MGGAEYASHMGPPGRREGANQHFVFFLLLLYLI